MDVLRISFPEKSKDIDIFFESESDFQEAIDLFNDENIRKKDGNLNIEMRRYVRSRKREKRYG